MANTAGNALSWRAGCRRRVRRSKVGGRLSGPHSQSLRRGLLVWLTRGPSWVFRTSSTHPGAARRAPNFPATKLPRKDIPHPPRTWKEARRTQKPDAPLSHFWATFSVSPTGRALLVNGSAGTSFVIGPESQD